MLNPITKQKDNHTKSPSYDPHQKKKALKDMILDALSFLKSPP